MYEYASLGTNNSQFSGGNVLSLQRAILENECQLPRFGADSQWGSETEAGVRCLVEHRGREFVLQSWPWVESRMTLSTDQQVDSRGDDPVPWWFSWAAAGVGLVSIIAIGSILTRGK